MMLQLVTFLSIMELLFELVVLDLDFNKIAWLISKTDKVLLMVAGAGLMEIIIMLPCRGMTVTLNMSLIYLTWKKINVKDIRHRNYVINLSYLEE